MSKDIWKDAFEADWGISTGKQGRGVVPVVNASKLNLPFLKLDSNSFLGYFHPRPIWSLTAWSLCTIFLLVTNYDSGYWVLGLFLMAFTLVRGAVGVTEKKTTNSEDIVHGRIYGTFMLGLASLFGLGGLFAVCFFAVVDAWVSFLITDRPGRKGKSGKPRDEIGDVPGVDYEGATGTIYGFYK